MDAASASIDIFSAHSCEIFPRKALHQSARAGTRCIAPQGSLLGKYYAVHRFVLSRELTDCLIYPVDKSASTAYALDTFYAFL
jgi:hypothetical protein